MSKTKPVAITVYVAKAGLRSMLGLDHRLTSIKRSVPAPSHDFLSLIGAICSDGFNVRF